MTSMQPLNVTQCQQVGGGLGPLLGGAYAIATSKSFVAFLTTIGLISVAADIGTDVIE